jgi:hypothetical protein
MLMTAYARWDARREVVSESRKAAHVDELGYLTMHWSQQIAQIRIFEPLYALEEALDLSAVAIRRR